MFEALALTFLSLSTLISAYKVKTLEDKVEKSKCKCLCNMENYAQRQYFGEL